MPTFVGTILISIEGREISVWVIDMQCVHVVVAGCAERRIFGAIGMVKPISVIIVPLKQMMTLRMMMNNKEVCEKRGKSCGKTKRMVRYQ